MALGIDPTVDYAFKRLFGDPKHATVLIHLLNAIFEGNFRVAGVEILLPVEHVLRTIAAGRSVHQSRARVLPLLLESNHVARDAVVSFKVSPLLSGRTSGLDGSS